MIGRMISVGFHALRGIAVEYKLPVVMMVGLLAHESAAPPVQSKNYGARIVTPILDAMGIAYEYLHSAGDEQRIGLDDSRALTALEQGECSADVLHLRPAGVDESAVRRTT